MDTRALLAAQWMMKERGYVVIGFEPKQCNVEQGDSVLRFANEPIPGYELIVTKPTDRADWNGQAEALARVDPSVRNPPRQRGERFFQCKLAPLPAETQVQPSDGAQA